MKRLLIVICCFCVSNLEAQSIHFNLTTQFPLSWNLSDINQILYGATDLTVDFAAGGSYDIPYSQIISFHFEETNVSVNDFFFESEYHFTLYPNPANDVIQLSYYLKGSDHMRAAIYHSDGRLVKEVVLGARIQGTQSEVIDILELSAGSYVCKLSGNTWSSVLPWIKLKRE